MRVTTSNLGKTEKQTIASVLWLEHQTQTVGAQALSNCLLDVHACDVARWVVEGQTCY